METVTILVIASINLAIGAIYVAVGYFTGLYIGYNKGYEQGKEDHY